MTDYDNIKSFPESDRDWTEEHWKYMLDYLVDIGMVKYSEVASLVLGHLNPSQVGTSVASNKSFQSHYPPRKCWEAVRQWHFDQTGKCADCGTRLELQADHIIPKEELGDAANTLDNMTLRCRRCNVYSCNTSSIYTWFKRTKIKTNTTLCKRIAIFWN